LGGGAHGQDEESERSEVGDDKGVGRLLEIRNGLFCNFATVSVNSGRREYLSNMVSELRLRFRRLQLPCFRSDFFPLFVSSLPRLMCAMVALLLLLKVLIWAFAAPSHVDFMVAGPIEVHCSRKSLLLLPPKASLALILLAAGSVHLRRPPLEPPGSTCLGRPPDRGCPPDRGRRWMPAGAAPPLLAAGRPPDLQIAARCRRSGLCPKLSFASTGCSLALTRCQIGSCAGSKLLVSVVGLCC
jgi:hypothetical protein